MKKPFNMRRIYFVAALLCMTLFAVHAKENNPSSKIKLQTAKHRHTLLTFESEQHPHYEMLMPIHSNPLRITKHSHSLSSPAPQTTNETSLLLDSIETKNFDGTYVSKTIYGYNSRGIRVFLLSYGWNNETQQWTNIHKYEYEHNANDDLTKRVYHIWNSIAGIWQVSTKSETVWSMDTENNKSYVCIISEWDNISQSLKHISKEETVLHGNTSAYKIRTMYNFTSEGLWLPTSKIEQLYNDDGYDITIANYSWNALSGLWIGTNKTGYGYSPDDSYLQFRSTYSYMNAARDWMNRIETEYDSYSNEIATAYYNKKLSQWYATSKTGKEGEYIVHYDVVNNNFVKTYKEITYLDENNNLSSYNRQDWDEETQRWHTSNVVTECVWDFLSDEWRVNRYISFGYDKSGRELYRIQLVRDNSNSPWQTDYTYKKENIFDESGRQTASIIYNWAGGEPTAYESTFSPGLYTATATSYFNGLQTWTITLTKDYENPNLYRLSNLVPGSPTPSTEISAIVNSERTAIKIPVKQEFNSVSYYVCLDGLYGPEGKTTIPAGDSITGILEPNGTIHIQDVFGTQSYTHSTGNPVGWYNIFKPGAVFVPNEKKRGKYEWSFNWTESQRSTYYYSEHDVSDNVPAYEVKTQAYPNPANDRLTISGTKAGQNIRITNLSGQQVNTFTAEEGNTIINLSSFNAGVYLVNIDNFSVKIVKEQ